MRSSRSATTSNGTAIRWRTRSARRKSPTFAPGSRSVSQRHRPDAHTVEGSGARGDPMSEAKKHRWLPQFCSLPTLFAVMVVAEIVALVVVFAPDAHARPWLPRLGV